MIGAVPAAEKMAALHMLADVLPNQIDILATQRLDSNNLFSVAKA